MKKDFKNINICQISKVLFIMVALLSVTAIAAYAGPGGFGSDPDTPIDGGISLLVAAGVGIGIKKVKEMRKKKENDGAIKK